MRFAELVAEATSLMTADRAVLGICGPPGAGKSTLAQRLVAALGPDSVHVGMDGFHLAQVELARLGRTERKGAPDTFDAAGYVHLLARLAAPNDDPVYAPLFRRDLEEPIAGAVPVPREVRLVVTEGNYLLLPDPPWSGVRPLLTRAWFLAPEEDLRRRWLQARHEAYGRTPEQARDRTLGSDERNALLINATRSAADLVVSAVSY
ncbi:nucleoside/nucleotide kinase family protein [Actinophytocola xanthii]|uniref:Nucleoside/nucleotide kinase family protein n=1 Tax=Actinophytocola xanthii TaxID=1912961 RepID=A0A1Q8CMJ5_9PSEU|nr:nucleoside/nucleotide kinase family protein [Actinophytocola xanthii]OLF15583.1 nucleoside/nucleotide kinase family protein [Actinophytocola xanthii]